MFEVVCVTDTLPWPIRVNVFILIACYRNTLIPTKSVVLGEGMVPKIREGDHFEITYFRLSKVK